MTKYEVWHEVQHSFLIGEFEAESKEEAEEKAIKRFTSVPPHDIDDYSSSEEFIVDEVETKYERKVNDGI